MRRFADRFVLEREVGSGGMARVFLGRDEVLDRPVAVKVLKPMHGETEIGARFRREGRTAARLSHPNIVQVYDAGEAELDDRETSYIVMEYLSGGDLKELIDREGRLPGPELARIGQQVCSGLAHAHGRGVVHRDIKPHNIMLDDHGRAKVSDFGIAHALDTTQATRTGAYLGTALYSSPEQLQGHKVTPKTDVYALGVTMYQAATGEPLFTGTPIEIASQHVSKPPEPPSERDPDLDLGGDLEALILACLAKEAADRPTAEEASSRFGAATAIPEHIREEPDESVPPPPPEQRPPERPQPARPRRTSDARTERRGRLPGVLAGVALLAVLAVIGLFALSNDATTGGDAAQGGSDGSGNSQDGGQGSQGEQANAGGESTEGNSGGGQSQQATSEPTAASASASASPGAGNGGDSDEDPRGESNQEVLQVQGVPPAQAAEQTVDDFYQAAAQGDYDRTSQLLTAQYRQSTWPSRSDFEGTFNTLQSVEFISGPSAEVNGDTATVSFSTVARHTNRVDRPDGTATLVREGDEWRIDGLSVG